MRVYLQLQSKLDLIPYIEEKIHIVCGDRGWDAVWLIFKICYRKE
jgi:hypothetical protein